MREVREIMEFTAELRFRMNLWYKLAKPRNCCRDCFKTAGEFMWPNSFTRNS